jgi:recombination protein RecA
MCARRKTKDACVAPDDTFMQSLIADTNKAFKSDDMKVASEQDYIAGITFISSGNYAINHALTGSPYHGFAFGRIVSFEGESDSGKSLLANHVIAETQKIGGVAILFDVERARFAQRLENIGIDSKRLIVSGEKTVENIFKKIIFLIESARDKNKSIPMVIVVDSLSQASTDAELKDGFDKVDMKRAKTIRSGLRQIGALLSDTNVMLVLINHQTQNIGVVYGGADAKKSVSGGTALKYFPSQIVEVNKGGRIFADDEKKELIGIRCKVRSTKSRFYCPQTEAIVNIYFNSGIDPYSGLFEVMFAQGIVKLVAQGWYGLADDAKKYRESDIRALIKANADAYLPQIKSNLALTVGGGFEISTTTDEVDE